MPPVDMAGGGPEEGEEGREGSAVGHCVFGQIGLSCLAGG